MFVSLRLLILPADRLQDRDSLIDALRAVAGDVPGQRACWIAPVAETPVIHAGHIVWRMTFATENEALLASFSAHWRDAIGPLLDGVHVTGIGYRVTQTMVGKSGPGVWRALIFRTFPNAASETVRRLEDEVLLFPKYISTIKSWALSPISTVEGPKGFTHIWEQEFDSIEGLTGEYMDHPLHWGLVDSYFDAELPQYIVDPHVIQVVAAIDQSIMK